MSKLDKIFLAIVIALLIMTVTEIFFIFVYKKPPQAIPNPIITQVAPSPIPNPAVNPEQMKALANWPSFRNATLTLTETVTGTISAIIPPTPTTSNFTIKLYGQREIDTTMFLFSPADYKAIVVYNLDPLTGNTTQMNIGDLKIGDEIRMTLTSNLAANVANSSLGTTIYKIK
jgi:hypothetical protein